MAVDLPKAVRNPISLTGVAIATAGALVFLVLLALELGGQFTNPYAGLLVFVAAPAVFVIGLLIIPIGAMRQRRRIAAGLATDEWPIIDLRMPRTRAVILGVALITLLNVMIVYISGGSWKGDAGPPATEVRSPLWRTVPQRPGYQRGE